MKKKPLLFALLALAIVTSLTAGTLAVYTKSVELGAAVAVKKFAFTSTGGIDSDNPSIKLAPGESDSYSFTVSNTDDKKNVAEVDLNCDIKIDIKDAIASMTGLTVTLTGGDLTEPMPITGTTLDHTVKLLSSKSTTYEYTVTFDWVDNGNDKDHTDDGLSGGIKQGMEIKVVATQAT